jgi:hypothetical protein
VSGKSGAVNHCLNRDSPDLRIGMIVSRPLKNPTPSGTSKGCTQGELSVISHLNGIAERNRFEVTRSHQGKCKRFIC